MLSVLDNQKHFLLLLLLPLSAFLLFLALVDTMRLDLVALDIVPPTIHPAATESSTILKFANSASTPPALLPIVAVDVNRQLVDSAGQTRLFRGMGVCYKGPPFIPHTDSFDPVLSFADQDIAIFKRLGLNIVR